MTRAIETEIFAHKGARDGGVGIVDPVRHAEEFRLSRGRADEDGDGR